MAKGNRKAFEDFVISFMKRVTKGGGNAVIYRRLFDRLNDKQFEEFVQELENGRSLAIWASNLDKKESIVWNDILKLSKELGIELEQQLIITDEDTGIASVTPHKVVVGTVEVRRQREMLVKKFSGAKDDHLIDDLTGQVTGDSRASGISQPEITILRALGLTKAASELYSVKGGDPEALKAYKNDLITEGKTTADSALRKGGVAKVLKTAHYLLRGRHLDNNLDKK